MKLIVAMIRPEQLEAVQESLSETEACVISVNEVCDLRNQRSSVYRGAEYVSGRALRLEIVVVNEMLVREVVEAITRVGSAGDVFVLNLEAWVPIQREDNPAPSTEGQYALRR